MECTGDQHDKKPTDLREVLKYLESECEDNEEKTASA